MPELFGDRLFTSLEQTDVEPGVLLVAAPDIEDETLRRRVVLVWSLNRGYVSGLMLDTRTDQALENVLPEWASLSSNPKILYDGGPVDPDILYPVAVMKPGMTAEHLLEADLGAEEIFTGVAFIWNPGDLEMYKDYVEGVRIFRGSCFWPLSEVNAGIRNGDWYVIPALPSDVMSSEKVDLWQTVLRRQPMPLPLFSTYPAYPINN